MIALIGTFPTTGARKVVFAFMTELDQLSPIEISRLLDIDRLTLRPKGIRMTEEELVALANQLRKDTKQYLSLAGLEVLRRRPP